MNARIASGTVLLTTLMLVAFTSPGRLDVSMLVSGRIGVVVEQALLQNTGYAKSLPQAQNIERTLEVHEASMPAGVIEIVKVSKLHSPAFPADAQIEVKNISKKPIYFLYLAMVFPETKRFSKTNLPTGTFFYYGDVCLAEFKEIPSVNDKPILPGETATLLLPEINQQGFRRKIEQDAEFAGIGRSKAVLILQKISFGDGSGYINESPYQVTSGRNRKAKEGYRQAGFMLRLALPARRSAAQFNERPVQTCPGSCLNAQYRTKNDGLVRNLRGTPKHLVVQRPNRRYPSRL